MFTKGFGEILTDIMTINPLLRDLPGASAILDTSNYTFNAITFGKDSQGYNYHGHTVSSIQYVNDSASNLVSGYNDGFIVIKNYSVDDSSFESSATVSSYAPVSASYFNENYTNPFVDFPTVDDVRLERKSTAVTNVSAFSATVPDLGHYINAAIDPDLSSVWNVVGGFPPSGNTYHYVVYSGKGDTLGFSTSGLLSGVFNEFGLVDRNGYININDVNPGFSAGLPDTNIEDIIFSAGPTFYSGAAPSGGSLTLAVVPALGDAVSLLLFGGIKHIGVYCLDLKAMLASGLMPPYSWDHINNNRKYKLVAKVSFWDSLLTTRDVIDPVVLGSGLKILATNTYDIGGSAFDNNGPLFTLQFNFKDV
jgi:hypothetical protein